MIPFWNGTHSSHIGSSLKAISHCLFHISKGNCLHSVLPQQPPPRKMKETGEKWHLNNLDISGFHVVLTRRWALSLAWMWAEQLQNYRGRVFVESTLIIHFNGYIFHTFVINSWLSTCATLPSFSSSFLHILDTHTHTLTLYSKPFSRGPDARYDSKCKWRVRFERHFSLSWRKPG